MKEFTLQKILEFAVKKRACSPQLNKFKEFIQQGDDLSAWQTAMGNYNWLKNAGLDIDITYLEIKSLGIGKVWYMNGKLCCEIICKNGKLDGLYRQWYPDGQLREECTYKNGQLNGMYREWHPDGQLRAEKTYKDGEALD